MITIRALYDAKRRSIRREYLFGVYLNGELQVICTSFPSWVIA